jgi:hypothetical protein
VTPDTENLTHGRPQHGFDGILELVVAPAGAGKFTARLDDRKLCTSTKPFLDAARVLMSEGADQETVLAMRHEGNNTLTTLDGGHRGRNIVVRACQLNPWSATPHAWVGFEARRRRRNGQGCVRRDRLPAARKTHHGPPYGATSPRPMHRDAEAVSWPHEQATPIPSRRPDDPQQHASQRRAVAVRVVLALSSPSRAEGGPVA